MSNPTTERNLQALAASRDRRRLTDRPQVPARLGTSAAQLVPVLVGQGNTLATWGSETIYGAKVTASPASSVPAAAPTSLTYAGTLADGLCAGQIAYESAGALVWLATRIEDAAGDERYDTELEMVEGAVVLCRLTVRVTVSGPTTALVYLPYLIGHMG